MLRSVRKDLIAADLGVCTLFPNSELWQYTEGALFWDIARFGKTLWSGGQDLN